jgi:hypothetical protein
VPALTLIIATRVGIWADRRVTGGPVRFRPATKLVTGYGLVGAFCGDQSACVKAMRAVRAGETDAHAIAEKCDGLLVTEDGVIWELWNKLAERTPRREAYAAHGSGYSEAMAFLAGAGKNAAKSIRQAFKYVAHVRTDCGDGCDFRGFK